jgi:5'-3' exonuclease
MGDLSFQGVKTGGVFGFFHNQLTRLREKYLPYMGYRNIVWQDGYEADDLIAALCKRFTPKSKDDAIIVSSDADLFQLLSNPRVSIWNPQKKVLLTGEKFREKYGIDPTMWASVKAVAGCLSDNIRGIDRVGEKTAIKFLAGCLNPKTQAHRNIILGNKRWAENKRLTELPLDGTKVWELVEDKTSDERWNRAMEKLGMKSLIRGRVKGTKR